MLGKLPDETLKDVLNKHVNPNCSQMICFKLWLQKAFLSKAYKPLHVDNMTMSEAVSIYFLLNPCQFTTQKDSEIYYPYILYSTVVRYKL